MRHQRRAVRHVREGVEALGLRHTRILSSLDSIERRRVRRSIDFSSTRMHGTSLSDRALEAEEELAKPRLPIFTDVGIRKDGEEGATGEHAQALGGSSDETVSCSVSNLLNPSG